MKVLVVCKHSLNSEESSVCRKIERENFEIIYSWKNELSEKEIQDIDLVISIGGDGTALSASHFLHDKPILIVNSSPKTSEGFLTTTSYEKLSEKLDEIKTNMQTEKLERIKVSINGKQISPLALNEVFIANEKAYLISKYKIKFKNSEESHKSSGLIFSTGTGSTAWFKSAGGKPFSPQEKFIKMITREPYEGKLSQKITKELTLEENEAIEITPLTNSVLAIDSIREFKISPRDKIKIEISEHPLKRVI